MVVVVFGVVVVNMAVVVAVVVVVFPSVLLLQYCHVLTGAPQAGKCRRVISFWGKA